MRLFTLQSRQSSVVYPVAIPGVASRPHLPDPPVTPSSWNGYLEGTVQPTAPGVHGSTADSLVQTISFVLQLLSPVEPVGTYLAALIN